MEKKIRNIKLTVEYDGTVYHGFQKQPQQHINTIQGNLEEAIKLALHEEVRITGAARTDAGVHAFGQVVNFYLQGSIPVERIPVALNCFLPADIVIKEATLVDEGFHARYAARSKKYSYQIFWSKVPSAFWSRYSLFYPYPLSIELIDQALTFLQGTHDFKAFQASGSGVRDTVRTIFKASLEQKHDMIILRFHGDGFLYHMVRNIVGMLLIVGQKKITPEHVADIIKSRDRRKVGATAPPQGLCLDEIIY